MPEEKARDKVWISALDEIRLVGKFEASEIDIDVSGRTKRDVLAVLEKNGWLHREHENAKVWYGGPKAVNLLHLTEEAVNNIPSEVFEQAYDEVV